MPNADGTGPMGQGPLTGRGGGRCEMPGRGGSFRGMGRRLSCFRQSSNTPVSLTKEEEKKILQEEKKEIEIRLKELE